jgi:hypothetical protein
MKPAAFSAALLGAGVMLAFGLWKSTPWSASGEDVLAALALVAWVASPFVSFLAAVALSRSTAASGVVLALSLIATGLGTLVYADAFFRHASPVYALLFLSIPVLQWGIGVAAVVAALVLRGGRPIARTAEAHPAASTQRGSRIT